MSYPLYALLIVVMVLLSAWFSASEMGFNLSNHSRLHKKVEQGSRSARMALHICDHFQVALSTILIGNNLVNVAATTCMTMIVLSWIPNSETGASLLATAIMTVIILVFGEVVPKLLAKRFPEQIAVFSAYPIRILTWILYPLIFLVMALVNLLRKVWGKDKKEEAPTVTEEELGTIIETVEEEGVIDEDQGELLQSTLDFQDTTVYEIMTHRKDMVTLDIDDSPEEIEQIIDASPYSRIPVYEDGVDHMIGILYVNHYYRAKTQADEKAPFDIRPLLHPVCYMHKAMKLPAALAMFKSKRVHIAIVIDEFGGTMGMVTLEDILEELVGDIWDETDEIVDECVEIGDNLYEVSGEMSIDDCFEEMEFEPKNFESEYTTMGGWAVEMLEADPHVGDTFTYENLEAEVVAMKDMRVTKLQIRIVRPVGQTED